MQTRAAALRTLARRASLWLALAGLASLAVAPPAAAQPTAPAPTVLLLSFDGVRHDYLSREQLARGHLPNFARVAREGARATALVPAFPSSTFPSHVTLATGAPAEVHGIVANQFPDAQHGFFDYNDDARYLEAEPLWAAAERQGVRAAVFFWALSETAWRGHGPSYRRAPFDGEVPESEKVEQLAAWLALPAAQRPRLLMSWWRGTDGVGHRKGPAHAKNQTRLAQQDAQLGRLLNVLDARGLWPHTTLLLVSDHGMVSVTRAHDVSRALAREDIAARVFQSGGFANVHLYDHAEVERAVRALSKLAGVRAFPRAKLPRALRYDHVRAGDVVALAAPGTALLKSGSALDLLRRAGLLLGGCKVRGVAGEADARGNDAPNAPATNANAARAPEASARDASATRASEEALRDTNTAHAPEANAHVADASRARADETRAAQEPPALEDSARGACIGVHGHDPSETRAVHGVFLALGRGVPRGGELGEVRTLDVAATASVLLGIEAPQHSEGRALFAP